jgi:hypothetical protein
MKYTGMMSLAVLGMFGLASIAQAESRAFTNDNGTIIQAELVSHSGGKVTLKRTDGKEFTVNPSIFSADDETYIKTWMAKHPAVHNYNLKIEAEKKKVEGNSRNYGYKRVKNDLWSFLVTITNSSQDPVSNLKIEYRVFYTNSADGSYGTSSSSSGDRMSFRMVEGSAKLDKELAFNRTLQFTTTPVEIDIVDYDYGNRYKDEVKGCLILITDSNDKTVLEWRSPEVAMKEKTWANTSRGGERGHNSVIIR